MIPLRRTRPDSRSANILMIMNGRTNWLTMLGWPLAWAIMPGAKPINAPPTHAASRDDTTCRASTQYQAHAVSASAITMDRATATCGPNAIVTGDNGMVTPRYPVLPIRFTG